MKKHNSNSRIQGLCALATLCAFGLTAGTASAQFSTIDDFEGFSDGDSIPDNSADWAGDSGVSAAEDPQDPSNTVFQFPNPSLDARNATVSDLSNGDTATMFFQFRIDDQANLDGLNVSFGAAGGGNTFDDLNAALSISNDIRYFDGSGFGTAVANGDVALGTTYSTWLVLTQGSGGNGSYDLYLEEGRTASRGAAIASNITFHNDATSEVDSFVLKAGGGQSNVDATFLDNIYFDNTGDNAVNPVPEPSAYALVAGVVALLGLAVQRRR